MMNHLTPSVWSSAMARFRWPRVDRARVLLYLVLAAAEACVIYPWYLLFNRLAENEARAISLPAMIVLLWVPYLLAALLNRSTLPADRKQAAVAALMLVTMLVVVRLSLYSHYRLGDLSWFVTLADHLFSLLQIFPPDIVVIVVVILAWWRGVVLSRHEYDMRQVGFHFRLGIVILLAYFIVNFSGFRENTFVSVLAYFFFGLISVALARALEAGGIRSSALGSKQWVAIMIGTSATSLALALLVAALFSRQVLTLLLNRFKGLWNFLLGIVWYVVNVLIYLLFPLVEWVIDLFRQLERNSGTPQEQLFGSPLTMPFETTESQSYRQLLPYCNTILTVVLIVGAVVIVVRLIRQALAEGEGEQEIERESVGSFKDWVDDLRSGLRQGLDNLRAWVEGLGDRKQRSAASIRKIYASMVDLAAECGYPRRPAATPYEYQATLYRAFPGGREAVEAITEAYVRVHYGQVPDTPQAIQELVRHWETLQRIAGQGNP